MLNPIAQNDESSVTHTTQLQWMSASCSHVGLVRQINEDSCLDQPERGLWVVADGMGGHTLGDLASRMIVDAMSDMPPADSLASFAANTRAQLQAVNRSLRDEAALRNAQVIGSTVVVLLAYGGECAYLWAGDSRIYLYRNGRLLPLTRDHSQLEELRSSGNLNELTLSLVGRNLITRAVGAADTLDIEEGTIEVRDGDMFLLCSDGLSNEVTEEEIRSALVAGDCRMASETLLDMALQHGGRDNVSVVVARAEDTATIEKTVMNPAL